MAGSIIFLNLAALCFAGARFSLERSARVTDGVHAPDLSAELRLEMRMPWC